MLDSIIQEQEMLVITNLMEYYQKQLQLEEYKIEPYTEYAEIGNTKPEDKQTSKDKAASSSDQSKSTKDKNGVSLIKKVIDLFITGLKAIVNFFKKIGKKIAKMFHKLFDDKKAKQAISDLKANLSKLNIPDNVKVSEVSKYLSKGSVHQEAVAVSNNDLLSQINTNSSSEDLSYKGPFFKRKYHKMDYPRRGDTSDSTNYIPKPPMTRKEEFSGNLLMACIVAINIMLGVIMIPVDSGVTGGLVFFPISILMIWTKLCDDINMRSTLKGCPKGEEIKAAISQMNQNCQDFTKCVNLDFEKSHWTEVRGSTGNRMYTRTIVEASEKRYGLAIRHLNEWRVKIEKYKNKKEKNNYNFNSMDKKDQKMISEILYFTMYCSEQEIGLEKLITNANELKNALQHATIPKYGNESWNIYNTIKRDMTLFANECLTFSKNLIEVQIFSKNFLQLTKLNLEKLKEELIIANKNANKKETGASD